MQSVGSHIDAVETVLRTRFERQIRAHQVMPAEEADGVPFPDGLDPRLAAVLRERGIEQLYSHQADAFEAVAAGRIRCWSRVRPRARRWPSCCRS